MTARTKAMTKNEPSNLPWVLALLVVLSCIGSLGYWSFWQVRDALGNVGAISPHRHQAAGKRNIPASAVRPAAHPVEREVRF